MPEMFSKGMIQGYIVMAPPPQKRNEGNVPPQQAHRRQRRRRPRKRKRASSEPAPKVQPPLSPQEPAKRAKVQGISADPIADRSAEELFVDNSLDEELHTKSGKRLFVRYQDLVDRIATKFREEYNKVHPAPKDDPDNFELAQKRELVWYDRVRRWCGRKELVLRRVNRTTIENPGETAFKVKEFLEKVEEIVGVKGIAESEIANLDETSVRISLSDLRSK